MLEALGFEASCIQTAAVCVYPSKVPIAYETLKKMGVENKINVASGECIFTSRILFLTYIVSAFIDLSIMYFHYLSC